MPFINILYTKFIICKTYIKLFFDLKIIFKNFPLLLFKQKSSILNFGIKTSLKNKAYYSNYEDLKRPPLSFKMTLLFWLSEIT